MTTSMDQPLRGDYQFHPSKILESSWKLKKLIIWEMFKINQ